MTGPLLGIYGARGHGRDVLLFAHDVHRGEIVFIDDNSNTAEQFERRVVSFEDFRNLPHAEKKVAIAVANGAVRQRLFETAEQHGFFPSTLVSSDARVWDDQQLGAGALISPFAAISVGSKIGKGVHINTMVSIAHDCSVGDFVTFGPGAKCNGCVTIGNHAYIGSGALIKQGTLENPRKIGEGAVIGMGAVVIHDVEPGETVVGNPARVIGKLEPVG